MEPVNRFVSALGRIVRSRLFGVSVLAAVSAVMVATVSVNMHAVTVVDGDSSRVVLTLNGDTESILETAKVDLKEGDEVISQVAARSGAIEINRAFDVQVTADGYTSVVRMTGGTVADALQKVGVTLDENDISSVHVSEQVSDGLNICVSRVEYGQYTSTEVIPYDTEVEYTDSLLEGITQIKQEGKDGVKTYTYQDTYVDGAKTGTELVGEEVTQAPVTEIKLIGTKKSAPVSTIQREEVVLDANGLPANYSAVYTGRATAYTNDRGLAGNWTASGLPAQVGVVAVNPNLIPYGSKLYIVSTDGSYVYGYAIAGDTGGALKSGKALVDLFMNTYEECMSFGSRNVAVYVLS